MNSLDTLPFFIFVYLESGTFLQLLHIISVVISSPSFSINPICFLFLKKKKFKSHQLKPTFLDLTPFKKQLRHLLRILSTHSLAEVDTNIQAIQTHLASLQGSLYSNPKRGFQLPQLGQQHKTHVYGQKNRHHLHYRCPDVLLTDDFKPSPGWSAPSINKQPSQLTVVKLVNSSGYFIWEA